MSSLADTAYIEDEVVRELKEVVIGDEELYIIFFLKNILKHDNQFFIPQAYIFNIFFSIIKWL